MAELHHISELDFSRYHLGVMSEMEMAMIEEHLLWCRPCVDRSEGGLRNMSEKQVSHADHISTDRLELYHLGNLKDTQAEIEQHISECQDCADRTLAIQRFVGLVRAGLIGGYSLFSEAQWIVHFIISQSRGSAASTRIHHRQRSSWR